MIPDEKERLLLWMLGLEVLLVSVWEPVFLSPAERGKGRGWKGVVQFCFKGYSSCGEFPNSVLMILLVLGVFDKPWKVLDHFYFYYF